MEGSDYFLDSQGLDLKKEIWNIFETIQVPRTYAKGEMVYLQGERADCLYYLKEGRVKIFLTSENGMEKTLTILEGGKLFGEAAFLDRLPRMSSARTLTRICSYEIFSRETGFGDGSARIPCAYGADAFRTSGPYDLSAGRSADCPVAFEFGGDAGAACGTLYSRRTGWFSRGVPGDGKQNFGRFCKARLDCHTLP